MGEFRQHERQMLLELLRHGSRTVLKRRPETKAAIELVAAGYVKRTQNAMRYRYELTALGEEKALALANPKSSDPVRDELEAKYLKRRRTIQRQYHDRLMKLQAWYDQQLKLLEGKSDEA